MTDVATMAMLLLWSVLNIVFNSQLPEASTNILTNIILGTFICVLAGGDRLHGGRIFHLSRMFYVVPVIYVIYRQCLQLVRVINPHDYDGTLIAWDLSIFGVNPTEWMYQFSTPLLTEYLQFTYMCFFLIPIMIVYELYRRGDDKAGFEFGFNMAFGFYLSYLAYFALPAIGPRFTLHDFATLSTELPGVFLTEFFREQVNAGGGIVPGTPNPQDVVNRDCMPSGHTMMTIVNVFLAFRYKVSMRWLAFVIGLSLIVATVYLRYHYVVDLMAGAAFAVISLLVAPLVQRAFARFGFTRAKEYTTRHRG